MNLKEKQIRKRMQFHPLEEMYASMAQMKAILAIVTDVGKIEQQSMLLDRHSYVNDTGHTFGSKYMNA